MKFSRVVLMHTSSPRSSGKIWETGDLEIPNESVRKRYHTTVLFTVQCRATHYEPDEWKTTDENHRHGLKRQVWDGLMHSEMCEKLDCKVQYLKTQSSNVSSAQSWPLFSPVMMNGFPANEAQCLDHLSLDQTPTGTCIYDPSLQTLEK